MAGHVDRLKALTLPELRVEAKKRGLHHTGKKQSVLARLSVWVRDEVSSSIGVSNDKDSGEMEQTEDDEEDSGAMDQVEDNSDDESSEDELLFVHGEDNESNNSHEDDCSDDELEIDDFNGASSSLSGISETHSKAKSPLHSSLKKIFGFTDFREGQEWAIRRSLAQKVSLLVAPTGQGKSLCYALPAAMMEGVCIVVSPLVSLMEVSKCDYFYFK